MSSCTLCSAGFTEAAVPTGMKTGVWTTPCGSVSCPLRPPPSAAVRISNENAILLIVWVSDVRAATTLEGRFDSSVGLLVGRIRGLRRGRHPQVFVIPVKPALIPVANKTRPRESVELTRVHDQLCGGANALQRLIHLFAANERHVEVFLASHEQRRRLDLVRVKKRIRQLQIRLDVLPWRLQFVVVLQDVLIDSVHAEEIRRACAARSRLESRCR